MRLKKIWKSGDSSEWKFSGFKSMHSIGSIKIKFFLGHTCISLLCMMKKNIPGNFLVTILKLKLLTHLEIKLFSCVFIYCALLHLFKDFTNVLKSVVDFSRHQTILACVIFENWKKLKNNWPRVVAKFIWTEILKLKHWKSSKHFVQVFNFQHVSVLFKSWWKTRNVSKVKNYLKLFFPETCNKWSRRYISTNIYGCLKNLNLNSILGTSDENGQFLASQWKRWKAIEFNRI